MPVTHEGLTVKVISQGPGQAGTVGSTSVEGSFLLVNLSMFILQLRFPKFVNYCHLLSINCTRIPLIFARVELSRF